MIAIYPAPVVLVGEPERVSYTVNLPADSADYWVIDFWAGFVVERRFVMRSDTLTIPLASIVQGRVYKLVAYGVRAGAVVDGLYWSDGWVYGPGQASIEFTSAGDATASGPIQSFSGSVQINGQGVARQVVAVALDSDPPRLLAQTQSSANGSYTLEWQSYSGQMLVTALDDYGVNFETGLTIGVGDRVHPPYPNGHVYEAANLGTLGAEPVWPATAGETVTSGDVVLVAVEFWRPKSSGPFSV